MCDSEGELLQGLAAGAVLLRRLPIHAASLTSSPGPISTSAWPMRPPPMMVNACSSEGVEEVGGQCQAPPPTAAINAGEHRAPPTVNAPAAALRWLRTPSCAVLAGPCSWLHPKMAAWARAAAGCCCWRASGRAAADANGG